MKRKSGFLLCIVLLCGLAFAYTYREHRSVFPTASHPRPPKTETVSPKKRASQALPDSKKRNKKVYEHLIPKPVDPEVATYRIILDNNIFAPLGQKSKKSTPSYLLLGTMIPRGREIAARAILQERTESASIHVVNIGTKLGEDTFVFDIQPQKVTLKKGRQLSTIRQFPFQFLNPSRTRR